MHKRSGDEKILVSNAQSRDLTESIISAGSSSNKLGLSGLRQSDARAVKLLELSEMVPASVKYMPAEEPRNRFESQYL